MAGLSSKTMRPNQSKKRGGEMKAAFIRVLRPFGFLAFALALMGSSSGGMASTVGELLQKGAKKAAQADLLAITPVNFFFVWPNKQGEENLTYKADGTLTATGKHYASGTTSPGTGKWTFNDKGQFCTDKWWSEWNSSSSACFYAYVLAADPNNLYLARKEESDEKVFVLNITK
jgi:hypothetical protein